MLLKKRKREGQNSMQNKDDKAIESFYCSLKEGTEFQVNIFSYIDGIKEILLSLKPSSMKEKRMIMNALNHLSDIRRISKKKEQEYVEILEKINKVEE